MNISTGRKVADVFLARMADLTSANGYTTDAGNSVLPVGQEDFDPESDTLPSTVLFPSPDVTAIEDVNGNWLSTGLELREFTIEIVESTVDPAAWFAQSEDLVRDIKQMVLLPSTDLAKNWRFRTLGVKGLAFLRSNVVRPAEGADYLLVSATFAVRYVEHYHS